VVYIYRKRKQPFLQLGLEAGLGLGTLEDSLELGGEHDGALDLDLARHEQLLAVGFTVGKINKGLVSKLDGDIGLDTVDGAKVDGTLAVLEIKSPGLDLAGLVLDVELEDTLDLGDLLLALGRGEGLEVLLDLGEEGRGLETFNGNSYCNKEERWFSMRVVGNEIPYYFPFFVLF